MSTSGYVYLSGPLIFSRDFILERKKGEIMPHGVACENSHFSLLHAARDISPGYMVWQIKMGNVKQDTMAHV